MTEWFTETLYPDYAQRFEVLETLARTRSDFQDIEVFRTASHGRVMALDGAIQITERDEFVYQEMLAHVPLLAHGAAERVLIIGAGDGGVLRRVLQHRGVREATMVEIDGTVIRLAKEHLPGIGGAAWEDPRATIIVGDGIDHMAHAADRSADIVIVDSTDPAGVGEVLFTPAFYADCARVLGPTGILVSQGGVPFMQPEELRAAGQRRTQAFAHSTAYVVAVPTYVGGFMALGFSTQQAGLDRIDPATLEHRARDAGVLGTTRYWTPDLHHAAFKLPPYIAELLAG